jgi:hypothetical protein
MCNIFFLFRFCKNNEQYKKLYLSNQSRCFSFLVTSSFSVASLGEKVLMASVSPGVDSVTDTEGDTNVGNLSRDSAGGVEDHGASNTGERLLFEG